MTIRLILGALIVLGLITAWCAQLGEVVDLFAASQIRQAAGEQGREALPSQILDAAGALERNSRLWRTSLYAGLGIVVFAAVGLSVVRRTAPANSDS